VSWNAESIEGANESEAIWGNQKSRKKICLQPQEGSKENAGAAKVK